MSEKQILKSNHIFRSSLADTKLYAVLSLFTVYELNRLNKFVRSPYFNKNEDLIRLFEVIDKAIRNGDAAELGRQELWVKSTLIETYNDVKFRKLCSDLLKLIEKFLIQEVFEENSLLQADNLLIAVYNRKLDALYNSAVSAAERLSMQYHFRPAAYYYYEYSFERNFYNLTGLELARSKQANIDQIAANLDKFYVAEKLRSYITMIDRQRMATHDYQMLFMDEIFAYVESGNLYEVVPINLYYQVYLTRKEPNNPEHFEVLKALMAQHLSRLPQLEAFEVLDSALNYCINRINTGDNNYLREYMEMSLMGIKNELLLVNGALSPWIFRNIVVTGLRLRDFDWVERFIVDYQYQIEEKYRDNAVSFNLANLYFYKKEFNKVLELLQTVEYDDPSYNLNSKTILIATYYELGEIDSLSSLLASFEIYLRRKKEIPADRRHHYIQLIKFMRALVRIVPADTVSLQKLYTRISNTEGVVNKDWLLEKIDALLA